MRPIVLAAVTGLLLSVAPVSPAGANVPGKHVETQSYLLPAGTGGYIGGACLQGGRTTGGGHTFDSTTHFDLGTSASYGAATNPSWATSYWNGTPYDRPVTTWSVCADVATQRISSPWVPVQPGAQVTGTATCPAGTMATGGGFNKGTTESTWPGRVVIDTSRPLSNGWSVHAYNAGTQAMGFWVHVLCASLAVSLVQTSYTIQPWQGWDTVAVCPAGKMALGGGWSFVPTTNLVLDASHPSTFNEGWRVHADNVSGQARTITSWATCA